MEYEGYAGTILYVDLTSGSVRKEPLDLEQAKLFLGGWGLNQHLACGLLKAGTAPLSPDNPIIVGVGALCGTMAPTAAKVALTMKLPTPGSKNESKYAVSTGTGGTRRFGSMLKSAGYDHLIITGQAAKPSYLKISDDDIEICDGSDLWGKDLYDTCDELTARHRGATGKCGVWAIGRAGENLVTWAHALLDKENSLGRYGGGAVLGSKNLKAVVALGTKGVRVHDPKRFMALVDEVYQEMERYPALKAGAYEHIHGGGALSEDYPPEIYYVTKGAPRACMSCLVPCKYAHWIPDGRFAGEGVPRISFGIVRDFGRRLRIRDYRETIKLIELINRSGLDLLAALKMLYYLTRLYERGVIGLQDTGGLVLKLGDFEAYSQLLQKLTNREDIGDIAAEGWYALAYRFGADAAEDFADGCPIMKGADALLDARFIGLTPVTFSIVVRPTRGQQILQDSYIPRGEDLERDSYWPEPKRSLSELKRGCLTLGLNGEEIERIFMPPDFDTGRMERHAEDMSAVCDSTGVCSSSHQLGWPLRDMARLSQFYAAATGTQMSPRELKQAGERAWNTERLLNAREGFTRKDDEFPAVWVQNVEAPAKLRQGDAYLRHWSGRRFAQDDLEQMLDHYYEERGWDVQSGLPTKQKLAELGLEEIARALGVVP